MAYIIPETITKLQATAYLQKTELFTIGASNVMRSAAERLAEQALRKLLDDCILVVDKPSPDLVKIQLDVCILSPDELMKIIEEARVQGEKDALRWANPIS
jgi:hypothetical protein